MLTSSLSVSIVFSSFLPSTTDSCLILIHHSGRLAVARNIYLPCFGPSVVPVGWVLMKQKHFLVLLDVS